MRAASLRADFPLCHSDSGDTSRFSPLSGFTRSNLGLSTLADGAKPTWARLPTTPKAMSPRSRGASTLNIPVIPWRKTVSALAVCGWALAVVASFSRVRLSAAPRVMVLLASTVAARIEPHATSSGERATCPRWRASRFRFGVGASVLSCLELTGRPRRRTLNAYHR